MRRILYGPFCGELGWEVARWHAHLKWLRENGYKNDYIVACSYPDREAFYQEADEFVPLSQEFLDKKYSVSGYIIYPSGWPRPKIIEEMRKTAEKVKKENNCEDIIAPWLKLGTEERPVPMNNQIFQKLSSIKRREGLLGTGMFESVVIFARGRKDIAPYKNWKEEVWEEVIEWIKDRGYLVILAGKPSGNQLVNYDCNNTKVLNMISEDSTIDFILDLMGRAKYVMGNVSGTMHLANLCMCESIVFGPAKDNAGGPLATRFTESENPLKNKVHYIKTGKFKSPEFHLPFEKIVQELEKIL